MLALLHEDDWFDILEDLPMKGSARDFGRLYGERIREGYTLLAEMPR